MSETKEKSKSKPKPFDPRWPALMDREAAAAYLSVSERYITELDSSGAIESRVFSRSGVRFTKVSLDAWIESLPSGRTPKGRMERRPGPKAKTK